MTSYRFVVLHIMQGTLAGTDTWFHDPNNKVSAHFGVGKDGTVYQWVDTADEAWAEAAGNPVGISVEHEGQVPDALTSQQIAADAAILAWVNQTHGVPVQVTDDPVGGSGVCGHSTGAAQGWGHPACPGDAIMAQRQQIIDGANEILSVPVVTGISPSNGAAGGGDSVTITGTGFTRATAVEFGQIAGTDLQVAGDTQITVTSPPPSTSGTVDVTVVTPAGTSGTTPADQFTYGTAIAPPAPVVTAVNPSNGALAGGDAVTVSGSGFTEATQVNFGVMSGLNFDVASDTQLTVTSPAATASGPVDVTVTTPGGTSATSPADQFTYQGATAPAVPVVTGVNPSNGALAGGDTVTVTGTGLLNASGVTFGPAGGGSNLNVAGDTQLTVTSPAATASGPVDVTVTTPGGTSATSPADQFTYQPPGS
jgi:hypothetical protein